MKDSNPSEFTKNVINFYNGEGMIGSRLMNPSCFERINSHMGAEKHPTVGSSGEFWSMNGSLN